MVKIDTIYKSDLLSASLISSCYNTSYSTNDYNPLPAISFPVKSGYRYKAGKFDSIIDTNCILIEGESTEFTLFKFSEFQQDVTLTFQFHDKILDEFSIFTKSKMKVEAFRRSPQTDCLIKLFLATYSGFERLYVDQILSDLLFQELLNLPSSVIQIKSIKPWMTIKIDDAKEFIHSHSSEPISLHDISAFCNISPFHFSRVFKRKTGYTPYAYLTQVRISRAKQLLGRDGASVTSTAFDVGYNSLENFSYAFKKAVGLSPVQFKMSNISKHF